MTLPSATRTCGPHIPVPSTNDTARTHPPRATHGAHHPNGSPGTGSDTPRIIPAHPEKAMTDPTIPARRMIIDLNAATDEALRRRIAAEGLTATTLLNRAMQLYDVVMQLHELQHTHHTAQTP